MWRYLFGLEPTPSHRHGLSAVWYGSSSAMSVFVGFLALAKGYWWGLLILAFGAWNASEAYRRFKAGNI